MCIHAPPVVAEDVSTPDRHREQSISIHRRQMLLEHISLKRERDKRKREKKKIEEEKKKKGRDRNREIMCV